MSRKLFKNTTLKQKYIIYFNELKEFEEVETRSSKYIVFKGPKLYYFIGRSGAVRINYKNTVNGSRSQTDLFKKLITDWMNVRNPKEWVEV